MLPQLTSPRLLRLQAALQQQIENGWNGDREWDSHSAREQDKKKGKGDDDLKLRAHDRPLSFCRPLARRQHRPQAFAPWKSTRPPRRSP
jgi:hypothetical protein